MVGDKKELTFSALFFPERLGDTFAMYVSDPPPEWLEARDMTKIEIGQPGVYCLFFLVMSQSGGCAYITVNDREVRGSYSEEKNGEICGSAVCSIRERAIPCTLGIKTEGDAEEGILLVVKYNV